MLRAFWRFVTGKWKHLEDPQTSFDGKCVLVTGPTLGGLGYEAALKFATLGASRVILASRSAASGEEARAAIEKQTGRRDQVEVWPLDMSDYASVVACAERARALEHLDAAVLNAGIYMNKFHASQYGWEETLQVNVLSSALLGVLLLPKLTESTREPVLEFVGSGRHTALKAERLAADPQKPDLMLRFNDKATYSGDVQYQASKLFLMYAMQTLARMTVSKDSSVSRPSVLVLSVCPGPCKSRLARSVHGFFVDKLKALIFLLIRTSEQGSRTLVSGTLLGPEAHGRFWKNDQIQPPSPLVTGEFGERCREKVWAEIKTALCDKVPQVSDVLAQFDDNQ